MLKFKLILLAAAVLLHIRTVSAQYIGPQSNQKVAFLGDSITQNGASWSSGYVRLLEAGLAQMDHKIEVIPAGVSGNTSKDMLARLGDVLNKKPDWMLLSCGVNDVWHGDTGVSLDQYKINITSIVDQAMAAGIRVVVLAATPIDVTKLTDANNTKLATYNDFLRELAAKNDLFFIDLNTAMQQTSARLTKQYPHQPGDFVTFDGVHPDVFGNLGMAVAILRAWGYTEEQIQAVTKAAELMPATVVWADVYLDTHEGVSMHDYHILASYAERQNKSVKELLNAALMANVQKIIAETGK